MGNQTSDLIGGPFEEACKGKGGGTVYSTKCKANNEECWKQPIPTEYKGKPVKCGAIYQNLIPREVRMNILVDDGNCTGLCKDFKSIPIIGDILTRHCKSLKSFSLFATIISLIITVFLVYNQYYVTAGGGGIIFALMVSLYFYL